MTGYSIEEIIDLAIEIEKSGYAFYDHALKRKDLSAKAKELIEKLRDQEKQHEYFFISLESKDDLGLIDHGPDQEVVNDYLRAIVNYRIFNNADAAIKKVLAAKNELEIIADAIDFEKDTLLFFQGIKDIMKDSKSKDILEKVIHEEISHILWLSLYRDKISA